MMIGKKRVKSYAVLLSVVLLLTLVVGGTVAFIVDRADSVQNRFDPAYVTCQVNVGGDGTFDVTNTGNVDAYIRAAIAVNWMDSTGAVRGIAPTYDDYSLTVNVTDWKSGGDGFYYYQNSVSPNGVTNDLITAYSVTGTAPDGYVLSVEVVAEAIQAAGDTDSGAVPAYRDAWQIGSLGGN